MSVTLDLETRSADEGFFTRAERWLDERGKGAWIAAMVLGFVLFWPVGLALLAYMIWSKRMFSHACGHGRRHFNRDAIRMSHRHGFRSSGNTAFDTYKAETLQRLMDEQAQFEAFLERLRAAKDKQEFDEFMDERAEAGRKARTETADEAEESGEK